MIPWNSRTSSAWGNDQLKCTSVAMTQVSVTNMLAVICIEELKIPLRKNEVNSEDKYFWTLALAALNPRKSSITVHWCKMIHGSILMDRVRVGLDWLQYQHFRERTRSRLGSSFTSNRVIMIK